MSHLFRRPDGTKINMLTIKEFCKHVGLSVSSYYRLSRKPHFFFRENFSKKAIAIFGPTTIITQASHVLIRRQDALTWVAEHKPELLKKAKRNAT